MCPPECNQAIVMSYYNINLFDLNYLFPTSKIDYIYKLKCTHMCTHPPQSPAVVLYAMHIVISLALK